MQCRSIIAICGLLAFVPIVAVADEPIATIEVARPSQTATDSTSSEPVTIVTADQIARSGATTLDEVLSELPEFGTQDVNSAQNDGGYGADFVELRNLNFNRTLVLVDGQRFVLSGIRTDEAVDLNNIPLELVDHVEVLRDGSQPQYGPDAVAGVVNIVLKKNFNGLTITGFQGAAGAGDDVSENYSATWGHAFERGSVAVNLGLTNRSPILQSDRSWSSEPITEATIGSPPIIGSSASPNGHAVTSDGSVNALLLGGGQSRPYDPASDGYNDANAQYLEGSARRYTANAIGHYLIGDDIVAEAEILFTQRASDTLLPPQTLGLSGTARYPDGFVVPASNPFNPFGQAVALQRVLTEAGDQFTHTEGPTFRVVAGLQGPVSDLADWNVTFDHGESHLTYTTSNAINLTDVFATLADGSADYFGPDTLTPANLARIRYTDVSGSAYEENVARVTAHAVLAQDQGGPIDLTIGGEYRTENGRTTVSVVDAAGEQAGGNMAATGGGYDTREAFANLKMPLLRDRPLARVLSAEASARFTDTDRFGSFPTWKAVSTYAPDQLVRFRVTAGAARRPPAITEAFGGIEANYVPLTDPCDSVSGLRANPMVNLNCRAQGLGPGFVQTADLINVESGGNPDLKPEASQNLTIGTVLTPPWLRGFSLTTDYYLYDIKNAIDSLADTDPNYIPDVCYESVGLSSPLCALIDRAPSGVNAGQINSILARDMNIGTIKTSGVDFDLAWKAPVPGGTIGLEWTTTWLLDYRISRIGTSGYTQYAGTLPSLVAVGSYARVRSNATLSYARGNWSFAWTTRLISGATLLGADPTMAFTKVGDVYYDDVSATWRHDKLTLTAGINNITDQQPPTLVDGVTNTDTNTYDVIGRFVFLRCAAAF